MNEFVKVRTLFQGHICGVSGPAYLSPDFNNYRVSLHP